MPRSLKQLLITTQPGWVFATLAELEAFGELHAPASLHRDSSLTIQATGSLVSTELITPADVFGVVLEGHARTGHDATSSLLRGLRRSPIKDTVLEFLPYARKKGQRQYFVTSESWGTTSVRRRDLADAVDGAVQKAFPRWRRTSGQGLRFHSKADPEAALVGVQLYTNLQGGGDEGRSGALRPHLARGLLALSNVGADDAVFDPFMGTGTILREAVQSFGVGTVVGLEVDRSAFKIAERRLQGGQVTLRNASFEEVEASSVPTGVKLVSNIPFGATFDRIPTAKIMEMIDRLALTRNGTTLLLSRGQAGELAPKLALLKRNVLVLGQPAAIVYAAS